MKRKLRSERSVLPLANAILRFHIGLQRRSPEAGLLNLFQTQFRQLLNLQQPLCVLVRTNGPITFSIAFAECYCPDTGAAGKDSCLPVGLQDLKHMLNEIPPFSEASISARGILD